MANISVTVSLILCLSLGTVRAQVDNGAEKNLQSRLFSRSPANLTAEETLQQLKQLSDIFKQGNNTENLKVITELVNLSNINATSDTCNGKEVEEYRYQKYIHSRHPTIVAYLENYAYRRFNICQESYVKELNEAVATIDPQDAQAVTKLTNEVDKVISSDQNYYRYPDAPHPAIAQGFIEYFDASHQAIAQGVINYLNNDTTPGDFNQKYVNQVRSLCQRVLPVLRTQMRGHYNLEWQQESTWATDPIRAQWMQSGWMCNALIEVEYRIWPWIQYHRSTNG